MYILQNDSWYMPDLPLELCNMAQLSIIPGLKQEGHKIKANLDYQNAIVTTATAFPKN